MDPEIKKVIQSIRKISLSSSEKRALLSEITSRMRADAPYVSAQSPVRRPILSPYFFHAQRYAVFAFVAVFVVLGGSASALAQSALPGDVLYTVKVNINEEIRSMFAFNAESKAYFETQRAGERLEEAKTLAMKGELTSDTKAEIQKNLAKHVQKVQEQIQTIEAGNNLPAAIKVSENLEQSLRTYTKPLVQLEETRKSARVVASRTSTRSTAKKVPQESTEAPVAVSASIASEPASESVSEPVALMAEPVVEDVSEPAVSASLASELIPEEISDVTAMVESTELTDIVNSVQQSISTATQVREEVEQKILTATGDVQRAIAEEKRAIALTQIEQARFLAFGTSTPPIVATSTKNMNASTTLALAYDFIAQGDTSFATEAYVDAYTLFKKALESATAIVEEYTPAVSEGKVLGDSTVEVGTSTPKVSK